MLRRTLIPLAGALLCAAGALVVWGLAFHVPRAEWLDHRLLTGLVQFRDTPVANVAQPVAQLADPVPYVLMAAIVIGLALAVRGPRTAAALLFVIVGANLTTEYLKPTLAAPRSGGDVFAASWPSGHSTAAMSLALCALIAAPRMTRGALALVGGLLAAGVGGSVVLLGWHYPSDALGGFLVAGFYACLAVAGLELSARRPAATAAPRRGSLHAQG